MSLFIVSIKQTQRHIAESSAPQTFICNRIFCTIVAHLLIENNMRLWQAFGAFLFREYSPACVLPWASLEIIFDQCGSFLHTLGHHLPLN